MSLFRNFARGFVPGGHRSAHLLRAPRRKKKRAVKTRTKRVRKVANVKTRAANGRRWSAKQIAWRKKFASLSRQGLIKGGRKRKK